MWYREIEDLMPSPQNGAGDLIEHWRHTPSPPVSPLNSIEHMPHTASPPVSPLNNIEHMPDTTSPPVSPLNNIEHMPDTLSPPGSPLQEFPMNQMFMPYVPPPVSPRFRVNHIELPYTPSPPVSPLQGFLANREVVSDSDSNNSEELGPPVAMSTSSNAPSVDFLLLKSIDTFVLAVRTSASVHTSTILTPSMSQVIWPSTRRIHPRPYTPPMSWSSDSDNEFVMPTHSDDDDDSFDNMDSFGSSSSSSAPFRSERALSQKTSHPRRRLGSAQSMPQPSLLARQVANNVIRYARCARNIHEDDMCCLSCGFFPICPVTGKCGHTRCTKCIEMMSTCPCGNASPPPMYVNILIRELIAKTVKGRRSSGIGKAMTTTTKTSAPVNRLLCDARGSHHRASFCGPIRTKRVTNRHNGIKATTSGPYQRHIPSTARARFAHAIKLLKAGMHMDAAPQLALIAAFDSSESRAARTLLAQAIMVLSNYRDLRGLTREINQSVRRMSSMSGIKTTDMECLLCCDLLIKPVTLPCGHLFCRTCVERTLDYGSKCPLCLHDLEGFKLAEINDTMFIKGALASINALSVPKPMIEKDLVPIFVCTVAYPSVPCPLFIFNRHYWMMIRRVLESGSRRFGMVAMDREKKYADYGTILEVRDCIQFEDGRSILSTIGLSRFKVIERCVREGCEVARIRHIQDIPHSVDRADMKKYASRIMLKAYMWLSELSPAVLSDIENAFGTMPAAQDDVDDWWESADGPSWLWWLVAVLPLRMEIKVLILSTDCLQKRMMAVYRTLEAVARVRLTTLAPDGTNCQVQVLPVNEPMFNNYRN